MFCSACGQPMDPYQPVCPRCGRQVMPIATATPPPWIWNRVHRHVHTVGILSGISHDWEFPFGHGFDGFYGFPFSHMAWFVPLVTTILLARAILCVVTGIALLRRASWARPLALVTAFLTLIRPFTGTALAIYTLWVLLPSASGQEYDQIATS